MKLIIKTFATLILLTSIVNQVNSVYTYIDITNEKSYFLKYDEIKNNYVEDIKNGSINFSLEGNKKDTEFLCGEKGCFFINKGKNSIKDSGVIVVSHKNGKKLKIPYEINFKKSKNQKIYDFLTKKNKSGLDISEKLKYKTIQKRSLSCEISATADILSNLTKKEISEDNLLGILPKSEYNKLPKIKNKKRYWGNPYNGFVGYIDKLENGEKARQRKLTGYGVLEKPIEKIINDFGFKTKTISKYNYKPGFTKKEHLKLILQELEKGNMIQLWGDICTNPKYYNGKEHHCLYKGKPTWNAKRQITWYYKDKNGNEKKYVGLNGEHAFYLLGYKGDIKSPSHIIVWDTYTGKHTYPTSEWMRKWGKMQYRTIIVYKK